MEGMLDVGEFSEFVEGEVLVFCGKIKKKKCKKMKSYKNIYKLVLNNLCWKYKVNKVCLVVKDVSLSKVIKQFNFESDDDILCSKNKEVCEVLQQVVVVEGNGLLEFIDILNVCNELMILRGFLSYGLVDKDVDSNVLREIDLVNI